MAILGKLPYPWSAFWNRHLWFDEDGKPKAREFQVLLPAEKMSIDLDEVGQDRRSTSRCFYLIRYCATVHRTVFK